jgi:hypothetical protein
MQKKYCTCGAGRYSRADILPRAAREKKELSTAGTGLSASGLAHRNRQRRVSLLLQVNKRSFRTAGPGSTLKWRLRRRQTCPPGVCRIAGVVPFMHKITCNAIKFMHFSLWQQISGRFFSLKFFFFFSYIYLKFLPEPPAVPGRGNRLRYG